jgi:hypothetical protein
MEFLSTCYDSNDEEEEKGGAEEDAVLSNNDGARDDGDSGSRKRSRSETGPQASLLQLSLERSIRDSSIVPTKQEASQRQAILDWFKGICHECFTDCLKDGEIVVFGSWTYNMWVTSSDIDINVHTPERIPRFFPRLKAALVAKDPSVHVDVSLPHAGFVCWFHFLVFLRDCKEYMYMHAYACMSVYNCAYMHAYVHAYIHTRTQTCMHYHT